MSTVRIFLRGGGHFDLTAEDIETRRDRSSNALTRVSWTSSTSGRPMYLRLEGVDAIVELDGEGT
ncbi:hypothetical protein [Streptomyces sp. NPDC046925]|uniref:hypothetical protein n=1 Tax=Streptomyces sp. NPDC046925 TaxID=3155375 RepID=UPI003408DE21